MVDQIVRSVALKNQIDISCGRSILQTARRC